MSSEKIKEENEYEVLRDVIDEITKDEREEANQDEKSVIIDNIIQPTLEPDYSSIKGKNKK